MTFILADLEDINTHLPDDKIRMSDADDDALQIDASRYVKGNLAGVYSPVTLSSWATPGSTPDFIRAIAGRLIAAKWYAERYSEDVPEASAYAQSIYNEALAMLLEVRAGSIVLVDEEGNVIDASTGSDASFWPNDTTTPGPFFTMGMEFA